MSFVCGRIRYQNTQSSINSAVRPPSTAQPFAVTVIGRFSFKLFKDIKTRYELLFRSLLFRSRWKQQQRIHDIYKEGGVIWGEVERIQIPVVWSEEDMSFNPLPSNSHRNLDEQIAQLMSCKPLSGQLFLFLVTCSVSCYCSFNLSTLTNRIQFAKFHIF